MSCAICHVRRPRRFCPGVSGDICTTCCGTEREVTVDCPLSCEYLRAAHRHEKPRQLDADDLPNRDVGLSEEKLEENQVLVAYLANVLGQAALAHSSIVDFDVREALEALVRSHRTLQSGLVYESLPANPLAAELYRAVQQAIEEYRRKEAEETGVHRTRDSVILGVLVFLQHFEISFNNGRRRGRAFLDAVQGFYPEPAEADSDDSSLILP